MTREIRIIFLSICFLLNLITAFASDSVNPELLTVTNGRLYRNGEIWVPKGVIIVGRVLPKKLHTKPPFKQLVSAAKYFGEDELTAVKNFGADLIRFQVSQPGLNPASRIFDPDYARYVVDAVKLARSMGFIVLISMQWESGSGSYHEKNMPEIDTQNAWDTLTKVLPDDPGIMLEIFNEPGMDIVPEENWQIWHDDFQQIVSHLRQMGMKNILVVDGLKGAHVLDENTPLINDPLNKIVYAIHPYFNAKNIPYSPPHWDKYFGNFCMDHSCLVSEWNAGTIAGCKNNIPALSNSLLAYLRNRQIGLVVWAFDYSNSIMIDNDFSITNNFDGFTSCEDKTTIYGPGAMVKKYFHSF